jgi:hypothetical protein
MGVLNAYVTMLPRLEAEQQLATERLMRSALGHMKHDDRKTLIEGLQRVARGGKRRQRARKASAADLAAMGIQVEEVRSD